MTALIWVSVVLAGCLVVYSIGYYLCMCVFLFARPTPRVFTDFPGDAVSVLIPARNEGERAVRIVQSLLEQDHHGTIDIYLLLKDSTDSSLPFLLNSFHMNKHAEIPEYSVMEIMHTANRTVYVALSGCDSKSEKINRITGQLATPYTAIIDCDHQAHAGWIRSSLCMLHEQGARIIQCRRGPLSALGFFKLWDSLHQHVGCELFNITFSKLGFTVFFTGTTAVMETVLLQKNPLGRCITEDADFSYNIVLQGERIINNPYCGSDEELSPDLFSFLARRRRWANGHTGTFLRHIAFLESSPISLLSRIQFFYHGSHYLIALLVCLLHLVIGMFFVTAMSTWHIIVAALMGFILSIQVARTQNSAGWTTRLSEVFILFVWFFPAMVILINLFMAFFANDITRAVLPIPHVLQVLGLLAFGAPLMVLLAGLAGYRQLTVSTFLAVVITFPVAFYLDIAGVLIGLGDFFSNRELWYMVRRTAQPCGPAGPGGNTGLLSASNIKKSWQVRTLFAFFPVTLYNGLINMIKPAFLIPLLLLAGLFIMGILYTSGDKIRVMDNRCTILEYDGHPWITPPAVLSDYCSPAGARSKQRWSTRIGSFDLLHEDNLKIIDAAFWDRLGTTFFSNLAVFAPENIIMVEGGGIKLRLMKNDKTVKGYTAGSIATKDAHGARFLYGRFETVMKPAKVSGVITAFFLYRFDPWQEIDTEFLGRDTTRILLNVFYNPGEEGNLYNYGYRGTPVLVDLGFDAAAEFHRYAVEWDTDEIRWFVDDRLVHVRKAGYPTPIPHLPMRFHVNAWPICSRELAGPFDTGALPADAEIKSISIYSFRQAPFPRFSRFVNGLFSTGEKSQTWRDSAGWIQPER